MPLRRTTPLYNLHCELGAKLVTFAGYQMPLHYSTGILKEHHHTRASAGLFDVSHMGIVMLTGNKPAKALEALTPANVVGLRDGGQRYCLLLNDAGGIMDDILVCRLPGEQSLALIVNATTKQKIYTYLADRLPKSITLRQFTDRTFLALQGPRAEAALRPHIPRVEALAFQQTARVEFDGLPISIARSGYTGEDGFELSVLSLHAEYIVRTLLANPEVWPIGLGARDTLRLEAGFCLYGHDIDEATTPVEASLTWTIGSKRRLAKDFPAAEKILDEIKRGPARKRTGLLLDGSVPAREGAIVTDETGRPIGTITSGGFSPTLDRPIAMAYLETAHAALGRVVYPQVRGAGLPATVTALPFVPHRTKTHRRRKG